MKIIFTISEFIFFKEFWWRLAQQFAEEGDECIFLIDGKIAEYGLKEEYVKDGMKFISKVDWCVKNYNPEKNYFGNLSWKALFADFDRFKSGTFDYKNSYEITSQLYQFLDFVFKTEKPDTVITACPSNLFEQVARYFADKDKVPWLALSESLLNEDRIDVLDLYYTNSYFEADFKKLGVPEITEEEKSFSKNYIEKIVSHKELPSYMRGQDAHKSFLRMAKLYFERLKRLNERRKIFFKYLLNRRKFRQFDYRSDMVFRLFFQIPMNDIKRQLRLIFQKKYLSSYKKGDKFFFYPLHYQPEYTTSVLATYFTDQVATARNIAFSLPFPYKLYVKEHPSSAGLRQADFYEKLKQIPNIVLIKSDEKIKDIIGESAGIVTLTSSVGMEGAFLGKPVYVLGEVFYMHHPFCKKIDNFNDLKSNIEEDLNKRTDLSCLEDINLRFVTSYLRNTIVGSVISGTRKNDKNDYSKICRDLKEIFIKIKNS